MKEITKIMIKKYALMKLKYDFMGYEFNQSNQLSFHHLIVPHRNCKSQGLGEGYLEWNGAILTQSPFSDSHDYLHVIESYDYDMFCYITSEMIDENIKGYLDPQNIRRIHDVLEQFEREHCSDRSKKGKLLIKEEYTRRHKF
ncbi:MAG: hypothetical protein MJ245_00305 [Clostridia bacterium]|nr:hypothetical protein [Clostridia bacterium]